MKHKICTPCSLLVQVTSTSTCAQDYQAPVPGARQAAISRSLLVLCLLPFSSGPHSVWPCTHFGINCILPSNIFKKLRLRSKATKIYNSDKNTITKIYGHEKLRLEPIQSHLTFGHSHVAFDGPTIATG